MLAHVVCNGNQMKVHKGQMKYPNHQHFILKKQTRTFQGNIKYTYAEFCFPKPGGFSNEMIQDVSPSL